MKIIYPYPMHLSNGYTYMLSISQFLNELANYEDISLCSLDSKEQFEEYLSNVLDIQLNKNLNILKISNKKFGIKSNRLFFSKNVYKELKKYEKKEIIFYTRDFKQMKEMLKYKHKFKNAKYIFEVHQILSQNYCREGNYKNAQEMKKLEKYVFKNVDGLISITETLKKEIKKIFLDSCSNHFVLPVGFSNKFLNINNKKSKKYNLIYSGNFSKWKGIDNLLFALKIVIDHIPTFKVILIGADNKEFDYHFQMIKNLNLVNNIELYKRIEHKKIFSYIEDSEIGVLPNTYEGDALLFTSPLKLYEYLASGLKVVCSRLAPIECALGDKFLYWSKPDDIQSLADAIFKAYYDEKFDFKKQKEFSYDFTWEKRAEKFSNYLKQLK